MALIPVSGTNLMLGSLWAARVTGVLDCPRRCTKNTGKLEHTNRKMYIPVVPFDKRPSFRRRISARQKLQKNKKKNWNSSGWGRNMASLQCVATSAYCNFASSREKPFLRIRARGQYECWCDGRSFLFPDTLSSVFFVLLI